MENVLWTIARAVIAFLLLLVVTRLVGRKAISQMTFFDFTVAITFGSLTANLGIGDNNTPLTAGIVIVMFGGLAILTSYIALSSMRFRKLVDSEPVVVIAKGELVQANMRRLRITLPMLTTMLREKNAFNIANVEYAIMENDGKLSVLPKSNKQPLTPSDMNIASAYQGLTMDLIMDGKILRENLAHAGRDEAWLRMELKNRGIQSERDVLFAALDSSGALYVSLGIETKETAGKYGIE
jgi:uncharacterized membrane protein YcaP (DUF421 family)